MVRLPPYLKPPRGTWLEMRQYVAKGYWKVPYWMWTTARIPQPPAAVYGNRLSLPNFEYPTDELLQKRIERTAFTDDPDFGAPIQMVPGDVDLVTHPDVDFAETQMKLMKEGYSESEAYDLTQKRMEQDNEDKLVEQLVASDQAESMGIPLTGLFENINIYTVAYDEAFRKRADYARRMRTHGLQIILKEKREKNDTSPLTPEELHYIMPDFEEQYQFYFDYPTYSDLLPYPTLAPPEVFQDEPPEDFVNVTEEKEEELYREFSDQIEQSTNMITQSRTHSDMNDIGDDQEQEFVGSENNREHSIQSVYEDALKMAQYRHHPRRDMGASWEDMKIDPELKIPDKVREVSKVTEKIYKENIVEENYDRLKLKERGVAMKDLPDLITGLPDEDRAKGVEGMELAGHVLDPRGNVLTRLRLKLQDFGTQKFLKLGALNTLKRRQEYEATGFVDEIAKDVETARPTPDLEIYYNQYIHENMEQEQHHLRISSLLDLISREEHFFGKRGPLSPKDEELIETKIEENESEDVKEHSDYEDFIQSQASELGLHSPEEMSEEQKQNAENQFKEYVKRQYRDTKRFDRLEQSFQILTEEEMKLKGEELDNYIKRVKNTTYHDHFGIALPELSKDERIRNEDGEIDPKLVLKEKLREKAEQKEKAEASKTLRDMDVPELLDQFLEKTQYDKTIFYPELNIANSYLPPLDPENIRKIEKAFKVGGPRAVQTILYENDFIKSGLGPSAFADLLPQEDDPIENKDVSHLIPVNPGKPPPDMEKMRHMAEAITPHYLSPKEKQDFIVNESARMTGLDAERSSQLFRFQKAMKWFKKRKETEQRHQEEIPYEHYENMEHYPAQAPYVNPFFKKGEEDFLREKPLVDNRIPYDGLFPNSKFREDSPPQSPTPTSSDKPKKKK